RGSRDLRSTASGRERPGKCFFASRLVRRDVPPARSRPPLRVALDGGTPSMGKIAGRGWIAAAALAFAPAVLGGGRARAPATERRTPSPHELETRIRTSIARIDGRLQNIDVELDRVHPEDRPRLEQLRDDLRNVRDRFERLLEKALRRDPEQ